MIASPSGTSFFGSRLMVGFGGLSIEPPLLLSVFMGFWTYGLSCPFECRSILIRSALILTLLAFGGTSNFSSGITLCHNINPFCHYLAPSGMDITYDLGVFPHGVDITVTGCHRLTLGAFCSQTGCWSSSGGSPWHGHHACHVSCLLKRLPHCYWGLW